MTALKRFMVFSPVFVVLTCVILIPGCSNGKTTVKKEPVEVHKIRDTSLLFNGKSLDGWEITNFGPQGPGLMDR